MKTSVRRQLANRKRRILRRIEYQPGVEPGPILAGAAEPRRDGDPGVRASVLALLHQGVCWYETKKGIM